MEVLFVFVNGHLELLCVCEWTKGSAICALEFGHMVVMFVLVNGHKNVLHVSW